MGAWGLLLEFSVVMPTSILGRQNIASGTAHERFLVSDHSRKGHFLQDACVPSSHHTRPSIRLREGEASVSEWPMLDTRIGATSKINKAPLERSWLKCGRSFR